MCGKGPVPFPASSPERVARLVAVPEGEEGGEVPGTPCQAEWSSPRHSASHGVKEPLSPSRREAHSVCLGLVTAPHPATVPLLRLMGVYGSINREEPGMRSHGGRGGRFWQL